MFYGSFKLLTILYGFIFVFIIFYIQLIIDKFLFVGAEILLVGNRVDFVNERVVRFEQANEFAKKNGN